MSSPLASVVIPCFNAADYVGEAIESALSQTYRPVEVIVTDDGSTDRSLEVIKSFGEAIQFESGPNRGASAARNRGIELARGELIQFLDADDLLCPDKLSKQVPFAIQNRPAITYCEYERRERNQTEIAKVEYWDCGQSDPVVFIVRTPWMTTPAPLHWRSVLQEIGGFREDLRCSDEYELHMRLACRGFRFVHFPEVLYTVRKTPGGLTDDRSRVVNSLLGALCPTIEHLKETGAFTSIRRLAFAERLAKTACKCFREDLDEMGRSCSETACQAHPAARIMLDHPGALERLQPLCGLAVAERMLTLVARFPVAERLLTGMVHSISRRIRPAKRNGAGGQKLVEAHSSVKNMTNRVHDLPPPSREEQRKTLRKPQYDGVTSRQRVLAAVLHVEDCARNVLLRIGVPSRVVTFAWFLVGLAGSATTALGQPWSFVFGALLVYLKLVLDIADGELARYQKRFMDEQTDIRTHMQGIYLDRMQHAIDSPLWGLALGVGAWRMTGDVRLIGCGVALAFFRSWVRFDGLLRKHIAETFALRIAALEESGCELAPAGRGNPSWLGRVADTLALWVRNGKRLNLLVLAAGLADWLLVWSSGHVFFVPVLVAGAAGIGLTAMTGQIAATQLVKRPERLVMLRETMSKKPAVSSIPEGTLGQEEH